MYLPQGLFAAPAGGALAPLGAVALGVADEAGVAGPAGVFDAEGEAEVEAVGVLGAGVEEGEPTEVFADEEDALGDAERAKPADCGAADFFTRSTSGFR
jgi:hypothetical protein